MAFLKYNAETAAWETVAGSDASEISVNHEYFKAKDVHSALSEIYRHLVYLKQNITWLYRNTGRQSQAFAYRLPMMLAGADGGNEYIRTEADGRQSLAMDVKREGDEVSAEEFNALTEVINNHAHLFFKMGEIEVPTESGNKIIYLKSAEDIIRFLQEYGTALPGSNMRPKLLFEKTSFVFPQRGQIRIPFTIYDAEGGRFSVSFTLKGPDGSSSVHKFVYNDDYADGDQKAFLSPGENAIVIPSNVINTNLPGSYHLSNFRVFDSLYTSSEAMEVDVIIGTIAITEFTPPSLIHVGQPENLLIRYTSVLREVSLYYKITQSPLSGGDVLSREEWVDIPVSENFSPTVSSSYIIPIQATRNDEYSLEVYLCDTETRGQIIRTDVLQRRFTALDERSIYVLPSVERTVYDRNDIIRLDLEVVHQARVAPHYDIEIRSDGDVNMTLSDVKTSLLEGVSIQANTEMSSLTLTFRAVYKGTDVELSPIEKTLTFTITAPAYGSVDTGSSAVLWFDARGRNNQESEAERSVWRNKLKKNGQYVMEVRNVIESLNGWEQMRDNLEYTGNCLNLSAGAYALLPDYYPFQNFHLGKGVSFEVCMHSNDAMSPDTTLLSCGTVENHNGVITRNGIFITPLDIYVYLGNALLKQPNSTDSLTYLKDGSINIHEEEFIHITLVFKRDGSLAEGKNLCIVYINGIISNAIVLPDHASIDHAGEIILNGYRDANGQIKGMGSAKFRFVRFYNAALSKEQVLMNYIASMYNSREREAVLAANKQWSQGEVPFISKFTMEGDDQSMTSALSVPMTWSFEKGNELELYGDNKGAAEFIPDPIGEDGVSKFEGVVAYTKWQGSSSLDYLVKNLEMDIAPLSEDVPAMKYRMTPEFPLLEGFQLKTNYIDSSAANNICIGKIANQVWDRNWSNDSLKTIQKYRDPEMTDAVYLNPMFRVQDDAGKMVTYRYPMFSRFHALNGFPFVLYKDVHDKNAMNTLVKHQFYGVMMCNLKQDYHLYGYDGELNTTGGNPSPGPWSRHIYYRHDNNGQSTFASELEAYIGLFDPRAVRKYSRNGKSYEDIKWKTIGGVKRSLEECLGFEVLMCFEQRNPENMGLGLRNGKDHSQWSYRNLFNTNGFGKSLKPYTDAKSWAYKWEWNNDSRYMYSIGTGHEPMRRINPQDEYTFNALPVRNISKFLVTEGAEKYLEWDKYAALAYHQNLELINSIVWVATSADEDFANPEIFNRYFRLDACIDYVIMCMLFQMSDSLGRNLTLVSWDKQQPVMVNGQLKGYESADKLIFYPCFYDMDTSLGTDVYGSISDPYLPWPHAIGGYAGVETRKQDLYWIESDCAILEPERVSVAVRGYQSQEGSAVADEVKDAVFRYAYFEGEHETGDVTSELTIPEQATSVKVLMYGRIGAEEKLLSYLHIPVARAGFQWIVRSCERYMRSDYRQPYFSWITNNDNVVMSDQTCCIEVVAYNDSVRQEVSSVALKVNNRYVQLNDSYTQVDSFFPYQVKFAAGKVYFRCSRKDQFDYNTLGDTLYLRVSTADDHRIDCEVDMRVNNSFEFSYNCVSSYLWRRLCKHYSKAIMARYSELRKGYVDANNVPQLPILTTSNILDKYCSQIVNRIGEQYYNEDAFLKYFGSKYDTESEILTKRAFVGNARGNKFLFIKDFLKKRLTYIDAMLGYVDETTASTGSIAIRHGYTGVMTLRLASVSPAFITVQWVQGQTSPVYLPGNNELVEVSYDYGENVSSGQAWMKLLNCGSVSEIQGLSDRRIEKFEANGITALRKLDLSLNSFIQENPLTFIGCENLEDLSLANVTGNGKAITLGIEGFEQLKRLDISGSVVTVNSFTKNRLLEYVNISRNNFITNVNLDGCQSIKVLKLTPYNIVQLNISHSHIDLAIEESDERLRQWSNLSVLQIDSNDGIQEIVKTGNSFEKLSRAEIKNCPNLRRVVGLFQGSTAVLNASTLEQFLKDCPGVEDIRDLFRNSSLESLPPHFVRLNGTLKYADRAFLDCRGLTELPFEETESGRVYFLTRCPELISVEDIIRGSHLSFLPDYFLSESKVSDVSYLCSGLESLTILGEYLFAGSPLAVVRGIFSGSGIENCPATLFHDLVPTDLSYVFSECRNLKVLPAGFPLHCEELISVEGMLKNSGVSSLTEDFLSNCPALVNVIDLLSGTPISSISSSLFCRSVLINSLAGVIQDTLIEEIPEHFMPDNTGLISLEGFITPNLRRIGDYFLENSQGLESIESLLEDHSMLETVGNYFLSGSGVSIADRAFKNSSVLQIGHGFLHGTHLYSAQECFYGCRQLKKIGVYVELSSTLESVDKLLEEPYAEEEASSIPYVSSLENVRGIFTDSGLLRCPKGFLCEFNGSVSHLSLRDFIGNVQFLNGDFISQCLSIADLSYFLEGTEVVAIPTNFLSHSFYCGSTSDVCRGSKIRIVGSNFLRGATSIVTVNGMFRDCLLEKVDANFLNQHPYITDASYMFYGSSIRTIGEGILLQSSKLEKVNFCLNDAFYLSEPLPRSIFADKPELRDAEKALYNAGNAIENNELTIPDGWFANTTKIGNINYLMCHSAFGGLMPRSFLQYVGAPSINGSILEYTGITRIHKEFLSNYAHTYIHSTVANLPYLTEVEEGFTDGWTRVTSCSSLFAGCIRLTRLPLILRNSLDLKLVNSIFLKTAIEEVPDGFLENNLYLEQVDYLFRESNIKHLPEGFLSKHKYINRAEYFAVDSALESINSDLFEASRLRLTTIKMAFKNCKIKTFPDGFFSNLPKLVNGSHVFRDSAVTKIPVDLFVGCPNLTNVAGLFFGCKDLDDEIPRNLLAHHPLIQYINENNYNGIFTQCGKMHGVIPKEFLGETVAVQNFVSVFGNSGFSEFEDGFGDSITHFLSASGHFWNNYMPNLVRIGKILSNLEGDILIHDAFMNCNRLEYVDADFMMQPGVRFKEVGRAFYNCRYITSTLPAWWTKSDTLPNGANNCFSNCTLSLNWAEVPRSWGGPNLQTFSTSDYEKLERELEVLKLQVSQLSSPGLS